MSPNVGSVIDRVNEYSIELGIVTWSRCGEVISYVKLERRERVDTVILMLMENRWFAATVDSPSMSCAGT